MKKCINHHLNKKYYYQRDSLGNIHIVLVCPDCGKFYRFVPLSEARNIEKSQGRIEIRLSKAERRRMINGEL